MGRAARGVNTPESCQGRENLPPRFTRRYNSDTLRSGMDEGWIQDANLRHASAAAPIDSIAWGIVLNAVIPVILYRLSKRYLSNSELTALLIATTFPMGKSIFDLVRHGQVDPISIIVLLGIATDGVALLFGGSSRLLLVRESLFTGAFGFACFVSLLLPRPVMFYFGRHFVAGDDPQRQGRFNAAWQLPEVRFSHRLITIVWGVCICRRARSSNHFDLRCVGGDGPDRLADPARHPDHRHHDLGVPLWAPGPPARFGPAQRTPQPRPSLTLSSSPKFFCSGDKGAA